MTLNVALKKPAKCTATELSVFHKLVVQGGEVDPDGLEVRIRNAKALAFGFRDDVLIGVAAVKSQTADYRHRVFQKANLGELSSTYAYELGWVFVAPDHRQNGFAAELVQKSLAAFSSESIYATAKATNAPMHRTLCKVGFSPAGNWWRSVRGQYDLAMYLKPALQPSAATDAPQASHC